MSTNKNKSKIYFVILGDNHWMPFGSKIDALFEAKKWSPAKSIVYGKITYSVLKK